MGLRDPTIVKDLRRGNVTPGQPGAGGISGSVTHPPGSIRWLIETGRWRKPYGVFTVVVTAVAAVATFSTFEELDERGREHCFTGLIRKRDKLRDSFLGVDSIIADEQAQEQQRQEAGK
mmetsp:Transcript_6185/g.10989  ORF Transcript_6185/g.10989 Transcript_6185/m.10989 type:complete len:119 (+) Transcript_6185:163-519(+)